MVGKLESNAKLNSKVKVEVEVEVGVELGKKVFPQNVCRQKFLSQDVFELCLGA